MPKVIKFQMGWHTTAEPENHRFPIRFYLTETDFTDVAFCRTQVSAQIAVDVLNQVKAKPANFKYYYLLTHD